MLEKLRKMLESDFDGCLHQGIHKIHSRKCCALELLSVLQGAEWTDSQSALRIWDLRPLNDIVMSAAVRTKHLLPVLAAYAGSLDWETSRQESVASALTKGTCRHILSFIADRLPAEDVAAHAKGEITNYYGIWASKVLYAIDAEAVSYGDHIVKDFESPMAASMAAKVAYAVSAFGVPKGKVEDVFVAACSVWLKAATK